MASAEVEEHVIDVNTLIQSRRKSITRTKQKEIYVELKAKTRRGKCFGAAAIDELAPVDFTMQAIPQYNYISADIWLHVRDHIAPEEVQTFASICPETAALVRARRFWLQLYKKYCQKYAAANGWILQLPEHLQYESIRQYDAKTFRYYVIQALFYCHPPLVDRLKFGYSLNAIRGRTYVSSWCREYQCIWIICYKFHDHNVHAFWADSTDDEIQPSPTTSTDTVIDWESLASEEGGNTSTPTPRTPTTYEGTRLLVIICNRFVPFPTQLLYGNAEAGLRLYETRQMLTQDTRGINLELDFANGISKITTTVKYPNVMKWKVLPWWHPDFKKFIK